MSWWAVVALTILALATVLALVRMARGPSLADRVIALDSVLVTIASGIAVHAADSGQDELLNVMVVVALLGFTATVLVARFIEQRGAR
jgi:multicomponent Na+:H+ antiporter subunit F